MAQYVLWISVIIILLAAIFTKSEAITQQTAIVFWSALGVLAICEAIEKEK